MILLDPDLGPDLDASTAPRARGIAQQALHLPSIPILARFLTEARNVVGLRGQVTVLLTGDLSIRRLNRQFRGKNTATDVLSFPAQKLLPNRENVEGDLAISVPTARRQAAEQGHTLATEIKVLILHGLLHLAGYDHETDEGQMARRERLLRGRLGLPEGLIERTLVESKTASVKRTIAQEGSGKDRTPKLHPRARRAKP